MFDSIHETLCWVVAEWVVLRDLLPEMGLRVLLAPKCWAAWLVTGILIRGWGGLRSGWLAFRVVGVVLKCVNWCTPKDDC